MFHIISLFVLICPYTIPGKSLCSKENTKLLLPNINDHSPPGSAGTHWDRQIISSITLVGKSGSFVTTMDSLTHMRSSMVRYRAFGYWAVLSNMNTPVSPYRPNRMNISCSSVGKYPHHLGIRSGASLSLAPPTNGYWITHRYMFRSGSASIWSTNLDQR